MRMRGGADSRDGRLTVGGRFVADLAAEFGTPLYIYNEHFIKAQCASVVEALSEYPGESKAYYASKAYPNAAIDALVCGMGLGIDVSSHGELLTALRAGVPGGEIILHGSVKQAAYLRCALENGVGLIVVDAMPEIARIGAIAAEYGRTADILIRINPGVEAETHKAVRTANLDTKFGIPLSGELARKAVIAALEQPGVNLRGIHCHVGSQVFKMDVYDVAAGILLSFMKEAEALGARMEILNLGGGFGSWYSRGDTPMQMLESVQTVTRAVTAQCARLQMEPPTLMIEPGRAVVAEGCIALYTVEAIKEIPGVNTYLVTDGGLYENPRPLMYGSKYTAFLADRVADKAERYYTVAGLGCEADTVIQRVKLPQAREGDLLAIPSSGAYQLAYAGNYNRMPHPAAILVSDSRAAVIGRRQTLDEVLAADVMPDGLA